MTSILDSRHGKLLLSFTFGLLISVLSGPARRVSADDPEENKEANKPISYEIKPPFAWNRTDKYQPPNFNAFFPDDKEAGKQLDQLLAGKIKVKNIGERLTLVRRGLRNTTYHRTTVLGQIGNSFIWKKNQPEPRALELMYHASASDNNDVAHYALYHGPTVASVRSPNLVRMLMERYPSLDKQMQDRIAWGMKKYGDLEQTRKLLTDLLDQHQQLSAETVAATVQTYHDVFDVWPPKLDRFDSVGLWVVAYHRDDLSASHPRAPEIIREIVDKRFRGHPEQVVDFVTRDNNGYETAVVLIKGLGPRNQFVDYVKSTVFKLDFNEMLTPRTLQIRRLREFARHLPDGLPRGAKPVYTHPSTNAKYAHKANTFIAPDFNAYYADDAEAGKQLDAVYGKRDPIDMTDQKLLDLFRRGLRNSANTPNTMFGWIASSLGWPSDPRLTELHYQALDPRAPANVRKAANYYAFGLGSKKTDNILQAMYHVYMAPPFDRTTNNNMRQRILWGVRDHEDDKYFLAQLFEQALENHEQLSDVALQQAARAYKQLTGTEPPNVAEYSARSLYLVVFSDSLSRTVAESKQKIALRLGENEHWVDAVYTVDKGNGVSVVALVRGTGGMNWLIEKLQTKPKMTIYAAEMFTPELLKKANNPVWQKFAKRLPKVKGD